MKVTDKGQFRNALKIEMSESEYSATFGDDGDAYQILIDESEHLFIHYMSIGGQPVIAEVRKNEASK
jgi:hypothetical protein